MVSSVWALPIDGTYIPFRPYGYLNVSRLLVTKEIWSQYVSYRGSSSSSSVVGDQPNTFRTILEASSTALSNFSSSSIFSDEVCIFYFSFIPYFLYNYIIYFEALTNTPLGSCIQQGRIYSVPIVYNKVEYIVFQWEHKYEGVKDQLGYNDIINTCVQLRARIYNKGCPNNREASSCDPGTLTTS